MFHRDTWHVLHPHKLDHQQTLACHCSLSCLCICGLLSAISLLGCAKGTSDRGSIMAQYNTGMELDNYYIPASGINCLEQDIPPPNCH